MFVGRSNPGRYDLTNQKVGPEANNGVLSGRRDVVALNDRF